MHPGKMINPPCPLCASCCTSHFHRDTQRDYFRCKQCLLIFVPPEQHLGVKDEVAEYRLHENDPDDAGYRNFLNRLLQPLSQLLAPASEGLDFGSGPGPTLSIMLTELGHRVTIYDPHFSPATQALERQYDFICATEVFEHLRKPASDLNKLWGGLRPGGWLAVMTKLALNEAAFYRWHYKNDPTHIIFFSRATFHWLAECWHAKLTFADNDVIFLQKSPLQIQSACSTASF